MAIPKNSFQLSRSIFSDTTKIRQAFGNFGWGLLMARLGRKVRYFGALSLRGPFDLVAAAGFVFFGLVVLVVFLAGIIIFRRGFPFLASAEFAPQWGDAC